MKVEYLISKKYKNGTFIKNLLFIDYFSQTLTTAERKYKKHKSDIGIKNPISVPTIENKTKTINDIVKFENKKVLITPFGIYFLELKDKKTCKDGDIPDEVKERILKYFEKNNLHKSVSNPVDFKNLSDIFGEPDIVYSDVNFPGYFIDLNANVNNPNFPITNPSMINGLNDLNQAINNLNSPNDTNANELSNSDNPNNTNTNGGIKDKNNSNNLGNSDSSNNSSNSSNSSISDSSGSSSNSSNSSISDSSGSSSNSDSSNNSNNLSNSDSSNNSNNLSNSDSSNNSNNLSNSDNSNTNENTGHTETTVYIYKDNNSSNSINQNTSNSNGSSNNTDNSNTDENTDENTNENSTKNTNENTEVNTSNNNSFNDTNDTDIPKEGLDLSDSRCKDILENTKLNGSDNIKGFKLCAISDDIGPDNINCPYRTYLYKEKGKCPIKDVQPGWFGPFKISNGGYQFYHYFVDEWSDEYGEYMCGYEIYDVTRCMPNDYGGEIKYDESSQDCECVM